MNDDVYEAYINAGRIAASARDHGADIVKSGASILDVVEKIEGKILENGASLSFPVNISINQVAAHFSPTHLDEELIFHKGDVVKIDVGSHIDGYIADTARTVEVESNDYSDLIKASSEALDNAISLVKDNCMISSIGKKINDTIEKYNFKPVSNLTGHGLERYSLHSGKSIPNVYEKFNMSKIKKDDVIAIEPFATNGAGYVNSGIGSNIYLCHNSVRSKIVRDNRFKNYHNKLRSKFKTLPFAERWTKNMFNNNKVILSRLTHLGLIKHYPQLIEAKNGIVSQKEHTVIVTDEGCEITTK